MKIYRYYNTSKCPTNWCLANNEEEVIDIALKVRAIRSIHNIRDIVEFEDAELWIAIPKENPKDGCIFVPWGQLSDFPNPAPISFMGGIGNTNGSTVPVVHEKWLTA